MKPVYQDFDYYVFLDINSKYELPGYILVDDEQPEYKRVYLPVIGLDDQGFAQYFDPLTGQLTSTADTKNDDIHFVGVTSGLSTVITMQLSSVDPFDDDSDAMDLL